MTEAAAPPKLRAADTALFLDFDGTLVEIASRPDAVALHEAIPGILLRIARLNGGAVAIVTGRDIETIDAFIEPLRLPVAGAHGHVRRTADGRLIETVIDLGALGAIGDALACFAADKPGLLVERKSRSVALHYRMAPDYAPRCRAAVEKAVADVPGFTVLQGKFVYEVRSIVTDKGRAIADFMAESPFAGRMPIFAGDDVTDEEGFALVNRKGGLTIKVGDGPTVATCRLSDPSALRGWLEALARETETSENR